MVKRIFGNMRIKTELLLGFGVVIFISVLIILVSISDMRAIANNTLTLYNKSNIEVNTIWEIKANMLNIEKSFFKSLVIEDSSKVQQYIDENNSSVAIIKDKLQILKDNFKTQDKIDLLNNIENLLKTGTPIREQINTYIKNKQIKEAFNLIQNDYEPIYANTNTLIDSLFKLVDTDLQKFSIDSDNQKNESSLILGAMLIIGLFIALIITYFITKGLTKHIKEISLAAEEVSKGNLKIKLEYKSNNELGNLAHSIRSTISSMKSYISNIDEILNQMSEGNMAINIDMDYKGDFKRIKHSMLNISTSLREALSEIDNSAESIKKSSQQVANTSEILSQGAIEQASVVEEFTASIQEITDSINKNTEYIENTNEKSSISKANATDGNISMEKMLEAINEIDKSSKNIAEIIKIIDDIANQTNLLALNANIEAARAGEAGQGFAVVANEVRQLADQSSEAVKNIANTIQESIAKVNQGKQIAYDTSDKLKKIVESTEETSQLTNTILEISERQKTCLIDIQHGTEQVGTLVDTNSSTSEENAKVSQELADQSEKLHFLISKFNLE